MVLTVLEAEVAADREADLIGAFRRAAEEPIPPFLVRSLLVRSAEARSTFRIMTVFRTREDLDRMRASGETPRGVAIFREAGAEPHLSIFEIEHELVNPAVAL
ncbi:MAG TPA: hypothetical protein VGB19_14125 [Actinomycetota bacterium]